MATCDRCLLYCPQSKISLTNRYISFATSCVIAAKLLKIYPAFTFLHLNRRGLPQYSNSAVGRMRCARSQCGSEMTSSEIIPTRIINVGISASKDLIRLIESKDITSEPKESRYIALSYCWSPKTTRPSITTTASTLAQRKRGMDYNELPKTFQDAILMTRKLGIRYLWIDALYILQGDSEEARADWRVESSRMVEVYSGA
jgi:hypothetical protein